MAEDTTPNNLELTTTRHFSSWLATQNVSLMFTTYEAGKLFSIGLQDDGRLSIFERTMPRCMGLFASPDAQTVYLSTLYQVWRFEQINREAVGYQGFDGVYLPQSCTVTGDVDAHDIVVTDSGEVVFVNTLMSCLAQTSEKHSFVPFWKPPFVSKLAAEDRCHLNGLALREGVPRYVTSVSQTDVNDGWRQHRQDGGVVIDILSNEVIASGLSMPHSPRWYKDRIWLLNSGLGEFGYLDGRTGEFEVVAFCPGYARGMAFVGDYAVIGLSKPRENRAFTGLRLEDRLVEKQTEPRCGLQIVNLNTGDVEHSLELNGLVSELYDVVALPGIKRPMTIGFKSDEIQHVLSIGQD